MDHSSGTLKYWYEFSWYLEVLVSVGMLKVSTVSEFNLRFGSLGFALNWLGILSAFLVPSKYQTFLEHLFFFTMESPE